METDKTSFRIRYADRCGNVNFITRSNGKVLHFSASETPMALSNCAGNNAADLRFALEDAATGADAIKSVRALAQFADPKTITLL